MLKEILLMSSFILLCINGWGVPYEHRFIPSITAIQSKNSKAVLTLSDGSIWETQPGCFQFKKGDPFMIRWDNDKTSYYLENAPLNQKVYAALIGIPTLSVRQISGDEITLSNGLKYKFIPFIDQVYPNDRILLSLNENPEGENYPYFMVGYDPKSPTPKMTGEIQARLLN